MVILVIALTFYKVTIPPISLMMLYAAGDILTEDVDYWPCSF